MFLIGQKINERERDYRKKFADAATSKVWTKQDRFQNNNMK